MGRENLFVMPMEVWGVLLGVKQAHRAQTDEGCGFPRLSFTHDDISCIFVSSDVRGPGDQNALEIPQSARRETAGEPSGSFRRGNIICVLIFCFIWFRAPFLRSGRFGGRKIIVEVVVVKVGVNFPAPLLQGMYEL